MASSTQELYRKPARSTSEKTRYSAPTLSLAKRIRASSIPVDLHNFLIAYLVKNAEGTELYQSIEHVAQRCPGRSQAKHTEGCLSRRTVQYKIRKSIKLGILTEVYPAHSWVMHRGVRRFRQSATYQLDAQKVLPRLTVEEREARKPVVMPKRRDCREPGSFSSDATATQEIPHRPVTSAAEPQIQSGELPSPSVAPQFREPNPREWNKFVATMKQLEIGVTRVVELDGYSHELKLGDRAYKSPLKRYAALLAACKEHGIEIAYAKAKLRACGVTDLEIEGKP